VLEGEVAARTADLVERSHTLEQHGVALRRNEERTNYALGAADMGVWELDIATRRLTWSETMAPLFGLTPEEAPSTVDAFFALVHLDDRRMVSDAVERAARDGADFDVEFRALLPDGTTCWHRSEARPVRDTFGTAVRVLGVSRDISDRKSLEAQLRQSQKMEAIGQLAGGVAHDFNNLLTVILGYSAFVIDSFGPHDLRRDDMAEVVRAGERAASLTRQLLAFSRQQLLQPSAVDVNALVTGMHAMLSRLIGAPIELVPILAPDLHKARADVGQLGQVLMNLVVNARDAMPDGGRISVETANVDLDGSFQHEALIRPGPYVMLAVTDGGTGMSEATKQRLFEPFFTTKQQGKGTGLGLATTYGIVKQSNGYIWVYSEPGRGSTFKVYLPRATGESEAAAAGGDATPTSGTEHLLVVEDDDAIRALTRTMLEHGGYQVHTAAGPDEAEQLFAAGPAAFSLLITDVILPGSSGPALFARLARRRPDLKVLFVSGYTADALLHQGHQVGEVEFLPKPFTAPVLRRRVRELLDRPGRNPTEAADIAGAHP
jgi:PAS domain S-box-containing protein